MFARNCNNLATLISRAKNFVGEVRCEAVAEEADLVAVQSAKLGEKAWLSRLFAKERNFERRGPQTVE